MGDLRKPVKAAAQGGRSRSVPRAAGDPLLRELEDVRTRMAALQKAGGASDRGEAREIANAAARLHALATLIEARAPGASTAAKEPRPLPARDRDPLLAEAQRKVDAMAADLAQLEARHRAQLKAVADERAHWQRRIEELAAVEGRYRTLLSHLDASVTWRMGGLVRATRRFLRGKRRLGGKVN